MKLLSGQQNMPAQKQKRGTATMGKRVVITLAFSLLGVTLQAQSWKDALKRAAQQALQPAGAKQQQTSQPANGTATTVNKDDYNTWFAFCMIFVVNPNPHAGYYYSDIFAYHPAVNNEVNFPLAFEAFVLGKFGRIGYDGNASCERGQGPAARNGLPLTQQRKQYYWDLNIKNPIQGLSPHETGWTYNGAQPLPNVDGKTPAPDPIFSGQAAQTSGTEMSTGATYEASSASTPASYRRSQIGPNRSRRRNQIVGHWFCKSENSTKGTEYFSGVFDSTDGNTATSQFSAFLTQKYGYHPLTYRAACFGAHADLAAAKKDEDEQMGARKSTSGLEVVYTGWTPVSGGENATPTADAAAPSSSEQLPPDIQRFVTAEHEGGARSFCESSYSLANFIDCSCFAEQVFADRMSGDARLATAAGGRVVLESQLGVLIMKPLDLRSCAAPDKITAYTTKRIMANIFLPAATRSALAACASGKMIEQVKSNVQALVNVREEDILFGQARSACQTSAATTPAGR